MRAPVLYPAPIGGLKSRRTKFAQVVRASDDEDMVPIFSGRRKKGFTEKDYDTLKSPKLLGGKTIGDELALLRKEYVTAEQRAIEQSKEKLNSSHWDGDVYTGGRWNELSILYLIFMLAPAAAGLFAWLSYGHLWGVTPGLY